MIGISGIHHVTAIAGDAQENLDFYTGVLGMRLVKKTVNQDAPGTYHLFYADGEAHPGTDLTFFPWPELPPASPGTGLAMEVALAVPADALGYWGERLARYGVRVGEPEERRGERVLPVTDPHGLPLALVATADPREFAPWHEGPVPPEQQIRGLHAVRLWERDLARTARFLTDVMDFSAMGEERGWHRFGLAGGGSSAHLELKVLAGQPRGEWGTGGVHHVAWRVPDDATELEVRERLIATHRSPTSVIDRFWFKSVYFREPGGVLFEIATDGPGFTADEELGTLGGRLVLPPWLESHRRAIEAELPPLASPRRTA